jgi:hypothetical protein
MMFIPAPSKVNYREATAYCPITVLHAENDPKIGGQPHQGQTNELHLLHLYKFPYKPENSKEIPIKDMITHTANSAKQGRYTLTSTYILTEFVIATHTT